MARSGAAIGIAGVLPALVLIAALVVYPVGYSIWLGFFDKHSFFPAQTWVGLGNYAQILNDEEFWDSLRKGVVYAAGTTVLQLVFGVAAALVLNEAFRGRNVVRGARALSLHDSHHRGRHRVALAAQRDLWARRSPAGGVGPRA